MIKEETEVLLDHNRLLLEVSVFWRLLLELNAEISLDLRLHDLLMMDVLAFCFTLCFFFCFPHQGGRRPIKYSITL